MTERDTEGTRQEDNADRERESIIKARQKGRHVDCRVISDAASAGERQTLGEKSQASIRTDKRQE